MSMVESIEEGIGESSSPTTAQGFVGFDGRDIKDEIYEKLVENGNVDAACRPEFRAQLEAHFNRLPPSYQLDASIDRADDVLLHQRMLEEAEDPQKRPIFHVRFIELEELTLDAGKDAEDSDESMGCTSRRQDTSFASVHEITFSTVDRPKLLSRLSALLSDVGLNIREAHVFSTTDGYSLDVFVVDGWSTEDTAGLNRALKSAIERSEKSLSGSSLSAVDRDLVVPMKLGDWEIHMRSLSLGEKIGCGSCGVLYRGIYQGQDVAVKILKSEHLNEALEAEFCQEVNILRHIQHENIVRFIGACTKPQFCLVTEYMAGGSVYDFLHKGNKVLKFPALLKMAIDVCKGMEYLHQNNIVHRDLKTANLLMDANKTVKVADFGVARFQNRGAVMTAETGTYRWMAPEVINHQPYNEKADIFSFAIVLWELITSKIPYETMTPLQAAVGVRQGLRPELPKNLHPRLMDLIQTCWDVAPSGRPSFSKIKADLQEILREFQKTVGGRHHERKRNSKLQKKKCVV